MKWDADKGVRFVRKVASIIVNLAALSLNSTLFALIIYMVAVLVGIDYA